jgi:hypothetical protein
VTRAPASRPRRWLQWASGLLLIGAGCAELRATAQVAATTHPRSRRAQARVWFYRPLEPYERLNLARIDMNDSYIGLSRTVTHSISTFLLGIIALFPRVSAATSTKTGMSISPPASSFMPRSSLWEAGGSVSGFKNMARDTFYAWLIPPQVAQAEIARDRTGI